MISPEALVAFATQYGYLGVFMASLLGSIVPFLPLPYLIVVVLLSETLDPLLLGVAAGLGGSLGKITSYLLGRGGYKFFKLGTRRRMEALRELMGKYGDVGVFIFALTPLPDDVYLVPLGMMRFSFWRFLIANTAGKVILSSAVAYLGLIYFEYTDLFLGGETLMGVVIAIAGMVLITILLLRVDWELALKLSREKGIRALLSNLSEILSPRNKK